MAIYYLGMKTFGRSAGKGGSRATSGAAYRAGERIRDERTGAVYDHRRRADVLHKEIILPAHLAAKGAASDWARDRSRLWNAAEHAEARRNARVAREFTVALPHELSPLGRTALTRRFAQQIADRYGSAVDVAIHAPRGDPRNFHAHLFTTTREVTAEGLGRKTALELSGTERHHLGLPRWREEIASLGERWATLANEALQHEHIAARISHPGRAERQRELSGAARLPLAAYHIEKRGQRSFLAERVRERHRARLERAREAASRESPERERAPSVASSSIPGGARSRVGRLGRLGADVQAAWRAVRDRFRERSMDHRSALDGSQRDLPTRREPEAERAPQPGPGEATLEERHNRLAKIRESWLTEPGRIWRSFQKEPRREHGEEGLRNGLGREQTQEHRREKDHGLEM